MQLSYQVKNNTLVVPKVEYYNILMFQLKSYIIPKFGMLFQVHMQQFDF